MQRTYNSSMGILKPREAELHDLDKRKFVKSAPSSYNRPDAITSFENGEALNPSFPCPVYVYLPGMYDKPFPSFEHALLATKVKDVHIQNEIRKIPSIREAKKYLNSSNLVIDHAA